MPPATRDRPAQLEPVLPRHVAAGHRQEAGQGRLGSQQVVVRCVELAVGQVEADGEQVALFVVKQPEIHLASQFPGTVGEGLALVQKGGAGLVADGSRQSIERRPCLLGRPELLQRRQLGQYRFALGEQVRQAGRGDEPLAQGEPALQDLLGQTPSLALGASRFVLRVDKLAQPGCHGRQFVAQVVDLFRQPAHPALQVFGDFADFVGQFRDAVLELDCATVEPIKQPPPVEQVSRRHLEFAAELLQGGTQGRKHLAGFQARGLVQKSQRLHGQPVGVPQAVQGRRAHERLLDLFAQGLLQRHEAAEQVTAIHGREVRRLERAKRPGVVPVVEVAVVAVEPIERLEGLFQPPDHRPQAEETEVIGRHGGEQVKADVGRRCAVGQLALGVLLVIIGRQAVVLAAHEGLEEVPGLAGDAAQLLVLSSCQRRLGGFPRPADAVSDQRRG